MNEVDSVSSVLGRLGRFRLRGVARTWVFFVAAAAFALGFAIALGSVDLSLASIDWWVMLVVVLVGVPLMTLANAGEYRVSGAILGRAIGTYSAVRIAVLSTAANLLPLPGGPLVKVKGLMDEGEKPPRAVVVTVVMAAAWLATSLLVAGLFGGLGVGASTTVVAVGSILAVLVVLLIIRVLGERSALRISSVWAVELGATLATALRLWLVAQALGLDIGSGALVLGVAPVVGAAVVFVPAGLGVRELIASLAAPAVGLDPAMGYLIAAVDRLAGMLVHGTAALIIGILAQRDTRRQVVS